MIAKHETTYNDGAPIAELRDLLPPEPEPTPPKSPEEDKTLDEQVKELTSEEEKEELTIEELFGTTGASLFRTLTAPVDADTPRRRNLLDR